MKDHTTFINLRMDVLCAIYNNIQAFGVASFIESWYYVNFLYLQL